MNTFFTICFKGLPSVSVSEQSQVLDVTHNDIQLNDAINAIYYVVDANHDHVVINVNSVSVDDGVKCHPCVFIAD